MRRAAALVLAVVLTGFALLLLNGTYRFEGQILVEVTDDHGLHQGDVFVLLGWLAAMVAIATLARSKPS